MSNDPTPVSSWATGSNDTWLVLKKGFKHLSIEYANLADKASQEVRFGSSPTDLIILDDLIDIGQDKQKIFVYITMNVFLSITFNICFRCSKYCLTETVLLSTYSICFLVEKEEI